MSEKKRKTIIMEKSEILAAQLDQIPFENAVETSIEKIDADHSEPDRLLDEIQAEIKERQKKDIEFREQIKEGYSQLFEELESKEFSPNDFKIGVPVDSLESKVGYGSLIRQLHDSFTQTMAFYRSNEGGALSIGEAREKAFHRAENTEEAKKIFNKVMSYPFENLSFDDLHDLYGYAPRVAEHLWEEIKREGRAEFESGHLAATTMFPVHYMKQAWNIAKYLGIRESFISEWQPRGGIELSLIDILAQTFFQWQYWMEQTVKRSQTRPREEHHEYQKWKEQNEKTKHSKSWSEGYWFPPYVHEQAAIDHAAQMADRFNRMYLRTLRQLRDLRRYSLVTINNPQQVNIAADGGKQMNISNLSNDKAKKITS